MDHETLKARTLEQQKKRQADYEVETFGDEVSIDGLQLRLVTNVKEAFDAGKLAMRYTPILAQYDLLVGDISADQLRLKGFYRDNHSGEREQRAEALQDYLYEYVNFGAPYFILENLTPKPVKKPSKSGRQRRRRTNRSRNNGGKRTNGSKGGEAKAPNNNAHKKGGQSASQKKRNHQFTIKKSE
ncbi:YutD family protein [Leuconostocaceae bacterium ESL0723]|nr:YutD family protein [Leuconostocaceae bacterium ESL0723]